MYEGQKNWYLCEVLHLFTRLPFLHYHVSKVACFKNTRSVLPTIQPPRPPQIKPVCELNALILVSIQTFAPTGKICIQINIKKSKSCFGDKE